MNKLLSLNKIKKTFYNEQGENKVLDDISFDINKQEIVAILGPSGCGKSTILNIISSLESPSEGEFNLTAKLGYMFQKDNLLPWRNILNNVLLGLEVTKQKNNNTIEYVKELLKKYNLYDFINYYPNELSGGMRQRVSLIRTLALKPDLLLLDEPFSALDAQTKLTVQNDVYNIIKQEKKSALIVTHDISEAISMADIIYVLTNRPSTIKKKFDIDLKIDDDKRTPLNSRKSDMFSKYFSLIWKELDFVELNNK